VIGSAPDEESRQEFKGLKLRREELSIIVNGEEI